MDAGSSPGPLICGEFDKIQPAIRLPGLGVKCRVVQLVNRGGREGRGGGQEEEDKKEDEGEGKEED